MKRFTILFCTLFLAAICHAQSTCSRCGGSGGITCFTCGGRGYIVQTVFNPYGGYQNVTVQCPACLGYKQVVCPNCSGTGQAYNPSFNGEWIKVKVHVDKCTGGRFHGLCSCKTYIGFRRAGLNQYRGRCEKCGHDPAYHGLREG